MQKTFYQTRHILSKQVYKLIQ